MGEMIEVTDENGDVVMVPLHPLLARLADAMRDRVPYTTSTSRPGEWLKIDLETDS